MATLAATHVNPSHYSCTHLVSSPLLPDLSSSKARSAPCTSSTLPPERSSRSAAVSAGTRTRSDHIGQVRNSQNSPRETSSNTEWDSVFELMKWKYRGRGVGL